jgi:hypothetical protein
VLDTTRNPPRGAYVYRSHSGYYGIVNSEEGYQNLTRFLFGDVRIPNRATTLVDGTATDDRLEFRIPIVQKNRPGIDATLVLSASVWNAMKA